MAPLALFALALVPTAMAIGTPITVGSQTETSIPYILPGESYTGSVKFGPLTESGGPLKGPSGISLAPGPVIVSSHTDMATDSGMTVPSGAGVPPVSATGNTMMTAPTVTASMPAGSSGSGMNMTSTAAASTSASMMSVVSSVAASASSAAGSAASSAASAVSTAGAASRGEILYGAMAGIVGLAALI